MLRQNRPVAFDIRGTSRNRQTNVNPFAIDPVLRAARKLARATRNFFLTAIRVYKYAISKCGGKGACFAHLTARPALHCVGQESSDRVYAAVSVVVFYSTMPHLSG